MKTYITTAITLGMAIAVYGGTNFADDGAKVASVAVSFLLFFALVMRSMDD